MRDSDNRDESIDERKLGVPGKNDNEIKTFESRLERITGGQIGKSILILFAIMPQVAATDWRCDISVNF
jgi:hypothetical protein